LLHLLGFSFELGGKLLTSCLLTRAFQLTSALLLLNTLLTLTPYLQPPEKDEAQRNHDKAWSQG